MHLLSLAVLPSLPIGFHEGRGGAPGSFVEAARYRPQLTLFWDKSKGVLGKMNIVRNMLLAV
eukprot:jgi/Botrbrau1/22137/Bobra.0206s0061.1